MTQEENSLLLKDLCTRVLYGVNVLLDLEKQFDGGSVCTLTGIDTKTSSAIFHVDVTLRDLQIDEIRPYLRPMSSMTEEEFNEYHNIKYNKVEYRDNWKRIDVGKFHDIGIIPIEEYLDWLNSHHFDYRGLIEKGLALEAPEGMYNN